MTGLSQGGRDLLDPGLFLHDIDLASGRAGFARTDRADLSAAPFLDHRWRPAEAIDATAPLQGLDADVSAGRLAFIWHTSFCASTLLAKCLDAPGRCLSLKEPRALVLLASLKQAGRLGADSGLTKAVFGLLARRFAPDEQILIKPSNSANILIPEAAALTQGRMLLLHSDCESFVLAMARHGRGGFAYVRERFHALAAGGHPAGRWPAADLLKLTDLELAALVWRMQMDGLEAASSRLGDRARSLDCRLFLEDPGLMLTRLDEFFGLGLGPDHIEAVVEGPLFGHNAKAPGEPYDADARHGEDARLRAYLGSDLASVLQAIERAFPRPPLLAPSLLEDGPVPGQRPAPAFTPLAATA